MPEGDTIAYAAHRMRPVLIGAVPDEIVTPQPRHRMDRWPQRLEGRAVSDVRTHGKHLFLEFEGDLVIHSHLRMTGSWGVYPAGRRWRRGAYRAWLILRSRGHEVVEFDGPVLELLTAGRARMDRHLAELGPDVLAEEFDRARFLARLRADDPTRGIGDALLDQRNVAGIGNIWKSEGCWLAAVDPWRRLADVSDDEAMAVVEGLRPGMRQSAATGRMQGNANVFRRAGRPCPRCGAPIKARAGGLGRSLAETGLAPRHPAGDDNRTTFWCQACQH
jgi:endonuclease VIII